MTYKEFNDKLAELGLNKRDFASICELNYTSVTNWGGKDEVAGWVRSWLENYDKARKYDEIKAKLGL